MHQTLARIDAELAQFVSWDGRSGDAASSSVTDLDDDGRGAECGYEPGDCDRLDHDSWSAHYTSCEPHDYEPEPEPYPTGEHLIARADLYEIDGCLTWPQGNDPNAYFRGWGVAEVWQRDGECEWWPEWFEVGLTLSQAVEAAERREINLGALLGSIW